MKLRMKPFQITHTSNKMYEDDFSSAPQQPPA